MKVNLVIDIDSCDRHIHSIHETLDEYDICDRLAKLYQIENVDAGCGAKVNCHFE